MPASTYSRSPSPSRRWSRPARFSTARRKNFALRLADYWNARLDSWTFVEDTPLARQFGVSGYYIRTLPMGAFTHKEALSGCGADQESDGRSGSAGRARRSPPISCSSCATDCGARTIRTFVDSLKIVDGLLKTDTPSGPVWHRYNDDGYGEHDDGSAFDGDGRGRGWPLLTGERGHYAVAAGEDALPYIEAMMAMSSPLGLIPEQVWDARPDRRATT